MKDDQGGNDSVFIIFLVLGGGPRWQHSVVDRHVSHGHPNQDKQPDTLGRMQLESRPAHESPQDESRKVVSSAEDGGH